MKAFKIIVSDDTGQPVRVLARGLAYIDALLCLPLMANDFANNEADNVFYIVSIFPDH